MLSSKFSILKHWHYRKILTCLGFSTNIGFFFFNHNYCYGNLLLSLIFLKRSLGLSHSVVFFYFFLHWSLWKAFLTLHSNGYIFPFLLCLSLLFFSHLFIRPPQTTILPFYISFSWGWSWSLPPVQCHEPPSIVLQALCLSDLNPWIYFSLPLYNCKGFDLGHTWMV